MSDESELYLQRAENELVAAKMLFDISSNPTIQKEQFRLEKDFTFYSTVISHSYYCIFYCAKAYLNSKNIKTEAPEEHKKTYEEFAKFVEKGILDEELLQIYQEVLIKAETLLKIFKNEKWKRGHFTYHKLPQANKQPAEESLENSKKFFKIIYNLTTI